MFGIIAAVWQALFGPDTPIETTWLEQVEADREHWEPGDSYLRWTNK